VAEVEGHQHGLVARAFPMRGVQNPACAGTAIVRGAVSMMRGGGRVSPMAVAGGGGTDFETTLVVRMGRTGG
jgi:hypothetical protein